MEQIPEEKRSGKVNLDQTDGMPGLKTHGLQWLSDAQVFTFTNRSRENDFPLTKCNFLKKMASLFNPMGFLAPFLIQAKILLQEVWTRGLDWDDNLDDDSLMKARLWLEELDHLEDIRVPRCVCPAKQSILR